jgi:hypothetical protein
LASRSPVAHAVRAEREAANATGAVFTRVWRLAPFDAECPATYLG